MRSRAVAERSSRSTARSPPTASSRPENGEASRELAEAVRTRAAPRGAVPLVRHHARTVLRERRPARVRGRRRVSRIASGGGSTDYAQMREAGLEAVRAEPWRYVRGVDRHGRSTSSGARCTSALPEASTPAPVSTAEPDDLARPDRRSFRLRRRGSRSRRRDRASSDDAGRLDHGGVDVATDHCARVLDSRGAAPFARSTRRASRLTPSSRPIRATTG